MKSAPQRHKQYNMPTRPPTPRTSKHRLSVDADLQIPDILNSASKKDLLRKASKRLESGEISQEDFLNMAHKIKHLFQYQEEKQQHSENWDETGGFPKKQLLNTTQANQPHAHGSMDPAELSYYEHKSKLRKTQVNRRADGEEGQAEAGEAAQDEKSHGHTPPNERQSKERDDPRPPLAPMIEDYNHGKEFPTLKSLPGLRFRRRADPRDSAEREWNSPLMERQRYAEEQKSGYNAPRRYGPSGDSRLPDPRRLEGGPSGTVVHRNCPSPSALDHPGPRFERERLSPLHQREAADGSPVPRFESPNSEHSDDGPLGPDAPPHHANPSLPKSILKGPPRGGPLSSVRQHADSPGHTPPHDGGHAPSRYDGPGPSGPSRPHPPGWYENTGPGPQAPGRFDGPHMPHGPMRGGDVIGRFDGPPHLQGVGRFDGPMGQQPPVRFEGHGPGPGHFEGPMQRFSNMGPGPGSGPMGFQQQQQPMRFDGPSKQMGPMRFEGPGPMRFEGPMQPGPRFDVPHQGGGPLYESGPGQQGSVRFAPQHNLQPPMRPMAPHMYDNPMGSQQNFNMAPQPFTEAMNPQFPGGPLSFQSQPNLQQAGNFNMQPGAPFNQQSPGPYYNPTASAVGMQQPVMGNLNQPFLPQNAVPFTPQNPQVVAPENHLRQVDVTDLLTKLISTGIIKPSKHDAVPPAGTETSVSAAPVASPPAAEEEDEDEPEEEDHDTPDLTSFTIDDMKQRYESVVTRLYSGNQCCLCSMRFTTSQTDMYADHLDWHFRQNHAGKVASKKVTHRRWYYSLRDWVEFEEIADLEERAKSHFFEKENEEEVQKNQAAAKEKEFQIVKAAKDQVLESCEICQEPFETYWVEEEEDWFLKNAVRVDDKNFHPACFEDYKNSSYIEVTPSPNKVVTEHPLSAFVKTEDEKEETSCAFSAVVKQEVEDPELLAVKQEEALTDDVQSVQSQV